MITQKDLVDHFGEVGMAPHGLFVVKDEMPKYSYTYFLKASTGLDLLVVVEDVPDESFAAVIIDQAPPVLNRDKPTVYPLPNNEFGFTHVIAVPSNYHGYLKGRLDAERSDLFLCIPMFRCEFSGDESEVEFKNIRFETVPTLLWRRSVSPKIRVYFDNPATGGGTIEDGVLVDYSMLLGEIKNLNGVSKGFIEITNYQGGVVEVLSPCEDQYILIRNREDEEALSINELREKLDTFLLS